MKATAFSPSPPFAESISFRIGVVRFHVTGNLATGTSVELGFYSSETNVFGDGTFQFLTPDFGSFEVASVPEPGTTVLMGAGLATLLLFALRSKRAD